MSFFLIPPVRIAFLVLFMCIIAVTYGHGYFDLVAGVPVETEMSSPSPEPNPTPASAEVEENSDESSIAWLLAASGLVVVAGGAWAVARARRDP